MTDRAARVLAAIAAALGLLIALTPRFIFPVCEAGYLGAAATYSPVMRCFWFAQAEFLIGALAVLASLVILLRPSPEIRGAVGVVLVGLGIAAILLSLDAVIGSTCGHGNAICQIGTKPAVRAAAGAMVLVGLGLSLPLRRRK